jgi:hypothetical protein
MPRVNNIKIGNLAFGNDLSRASAICCYMENFTSHLIGTLFALFLASK